MEVTERVGRTVRTLGSFRRSGRREPGTAHKRQRAQTEKPPLYRAAYLGCLPGLPTWAAYLGCLSGLPVWAAFPGCLSGLPFRAAFPGCFGAAELRLELKKLLCGFVVVRRS